VTAGVLGGLGAAILMVVLILMLISYCYPHLYKKLRGGINTVTDSGTLKVLIIYVQTTASLNSLWPDWMMNNGMRLLNLTNLNGEGLGLPCIYAPLSNPVYEQLVFLLLVPCITVAILGVMTLRWLISKFYYYISKCLTNTETQALLQTTINNNGEEEVDEAFTLGDRMSNEANDKRPNNQHKWKIGPILGWGLMLWIYVLYLLYFELANQSLEPFSCASDYFLSDHYYVRTIPWLQCYTYVCILS
jgi:hypothetical protein